MSLATVARSRRPRICESEWAHDTTIRPGDRYVRLSLPPFDPSAGQDNESWWHVSLCETCATYAWLIPTEQPS